MPLLVGDIIRNASTIVPNQLAATMGDEKVQPKASFTSRRPW